MRRNRTQDCLYRADRRCDHHQVRLFDRARRRFCGSIDDAEFSRAPQSIGLDCQSQQSHRPCRLRALPSQTNRRLSPTPINASLMRARRASACKKPRVLCRQANRYTQPLRQAVVSDRPHDDATLE